MLPYIPYMDPMGISIGPFDSTRNNATCQFFLILSLMVKIQMFFAPVLDICFDDIHTVPPSVGF